jgi:nucleoside-diphosphate-sugar epimerase
MQRMRVLVTGSTGFIGAHVVHLLQKTGVEVVALRHFAKSFSPFECDFQPVWIEKCISELTENDLEGVDSVIHLAAKQNSNRIEPGADIAAWFRYWNVEITLRLLLYARNSGVRRFIFAGSCFEYGKSGETFEFLNTDSPLKPNNPYAESKAKATTEVIRLAASLGIEAVVFRIFQAFGVGEKRERLWPSLHEAAITNSDYIMTSGEQIRDFVPVSEVARCMVSAAIDDVFYSKLKPIENLGLGKSTSVRDFAEYWWNLWGAKGKLLFGAIPYRTDEVMRYVSKVSPSLGLKGDWRPE